MADDKNRNGRFYQNRPGAVKRPLKGENYGGEVRRSRPVKNVPPAVEDAPFEGRGRRGGAAQTRRDAPRRFEGRPRSFSVQSRFVEKTGPDEKQRRFERGSRFGDSPRSEDRPRRFEGRSGYGVNPRSDEARRNYERRPRFDNRPKSENDSGQFDDRPNRLDERPRRFGEKPVRFDGKPRREGRAQPFGERPAFENRQNPPFRQQEEQREPLPENLLVGRNPIREAIKSGRPVEKLLVAEGELSGSAREIVAWAREADIIVQYVDRRRLDAIYENHQGMIAYVAAAEYSSVEQMLENAQEKGEAPFLILLDGITDPHNLGAILRTAECCGAHGVIVPERRSVGLTPAAVKASAGAVEYMPVAKVGNLSRAIDELKEKGVWIIGTSVDGEEQGGEALMRGAVAIVIGSEGEGLSRLVAEKCDFLLRLPMMGKIESLNASVAAGMVMYDVVKARKGGHAE
ncbi:MAG: 23S rRNA (guanosine(2251)-2'-O)-methyltransferase RlmB [Christensenellales bacterium]|jgi:23S rRNA (guanosine2251-2'-O)-methyltransferase